MLDPRLELLRIQNKHVYVKVKGRMLTGDRGHLILETEKALRRETGQPFEVFLEPRGDMNKLRQRLRGVSTLSVLGESRDEVYDKRYHSNSPSEPRIKEKESHER
jgi:hypothetical protein